MSDVRLFIDMKSIERAAANGLPFCGTDETAERCGAVAHLLKDEKGDGSLFHLFTADRDFLTIADKDLHVFYVSFDSEGSHVTEVTEPADAGLMALSHFIGEKSAEKIIEQAGGLLNACDVSFFGQEKRITAHRDEIREYYDRLMSYVSLSDQERIDRLLAEGLIERADDVDIEATVSVPSVDTSAVAFFTDLNDTDKLKEIGERLKRGERVIFSDLKALLHSLGHEAGFDFEIRKNDSTIHEDESGQLSMFSDAARTHENRAAAELYDMIMKTEQKAWNESLVNGISYGEALHKYFDDAGIEGYILDPLNEFRPSSAGEVAKAHQKFAEALKEDGQEKLYTELELPLIFVLYDMEKTGIYMDADRLKDYGSELGKHIAELEKKIYEEAGEEFNINSPKQLGEILFGKLHLPTGKKTKTGYSTSQKVLEDLAPDYPIVEDVLSYRKYAKLKSTYADGLFNCVSGDGRVHTTYQQTVTATGRLSSTDPNLQNIPIRLDLGKQIRKVFLPAEDSLYIDADYSQIELRVLAHMSGDENLIDAYRADRDIHTATAAAVFHVPADEVTPLMRRSAKAVNFGIVYGISSFGLGQNLSISRQQAQEYINDYFKAYPGLHDFLDGLVDSAKAKGYAETMYGRRRPVPELKDSAYMKRQFGERVAMNAPIQGTAADIIKIAMLHVFIRLRKENLKSRLLLQVHDELLIEAPESEREEAERILKEEMENAAALKVPLEIDLEEGKDWYSAH
ncbi:MAG: DNA polymerase I [Lachnospiraceae bacterium]|nr:DNA polymerase I [Lachnospiraceae bacterium]